MQWATQVGEHTAAFVEALIASREHPEQGYRAALGVLRLTKEYGEVRVDAACRRALHLRALSFRSVQSILRNKLDALPIETETEPVKPAVHANVRGAAYYGHPDAEAESDRALN